MWSKIYFTRNRKNLWSMFWKGRFQLIHILGLLGMYFDAVVVFVTKFSLLFRLVAAIPTNYINIYKCFSLFQEFQWQSLFYYLDSVSVITKLEKKRDQIKFTVHFLKKIRIDSKKKILCNTYKTAQKLLQWQK